jgi:hypothetical protein
MTDRTRPSKHALRTSRLLRVLVVGGALLGGASLAAGCAGKKNADGTTSKPAKPANSGGGVEGW